MKPESCLNLQTGAGMEWIGFEDALYERYCVNAITLTPDGQRRTVGELAWSNRLCEIIRTDPNGAARICDPSRRHLMHEAEVKKRAVMGECAAGMIRLVVPMFQNDVLLGFVSVCGRPYCSVERIYSGYIQQTVGVDAATIEDLLPLLKPIDYRELKSLKRFIGRTCAGI